MLAKIVARVHVGGLQAAFKVLESMESERHAELFAFVNGLFARSQADGQGVVGVGALHANRNVAGEVALLSVNRQVNLSDAESAGLFRGFQLEGINAGLVTAAVSATEERIEHVFHAGANHLVGTVDSHKGESVCGFHLQIATVFRKFC